MCVFGKDTLSTITKQHNFYNYFLISAIGIGTSPFATTDWYEIFSISILSVIYECHVAFAKQVF